jgi:predicted DNA-binding protein
MKKPTALSISQRYPDRISITISRGLNERLNKLANWQGRSLSNLCAYLLESNLAALEQSSYSVPLPEESFR